MDEAAGRVLYDHLRWLIDGQHTKLASLEGRAAAVLGWSGAQIALSAAVAGLVAPNLDGGWRTTALVLLVGAGVAAAVGAWLALTGVITTRPVAAVNTDLAAIVAYLRRPDLDSGVNAELLDRLVGSIGDPAGETPAVLSAIALECDERANALANAVYAQGAAVIVQVLALTAIVAGLA